MAVKFINPEELGAEIANTIANYTEEVAKAIEQEVDRTAKNVLEDIKKNAPRDRPKYYKGFKIKKVDRAGSVSRIIHNATHPGLVHLIEFGHSKRGGGGRVEGKPHVRPAYDKHVPAMERNIERIIKDGG